jgi:hypothetical protein
MLEELTCDGQELLAIQIIENHDSSAFEALLALSMASAGVTLIPGFIFFVIFSRDSNDQKVQIVAKLYSTILLIGGLIVYLSIVWFYLLPEETWICQLRQWFAGFGFSVFLGALFTRTLQIHRIYRISKSKRLPTRRTRTDLRKRGVFDFVYGLGLVMTGQLVILIFWSTVDTPEASLSVINDIERTASWVCKSDNVWLWIGLEIGFFISLLCYGILVVYRTWDLKSRFTEAKWLLMAIYNIYIYLLTLAALVPLFATIDIDDENLFYIAVAGLNFVLASTLLALYIQRGGPWLEKWIWQWRTSSTRSDKVSGGGIGGGSTGSTPHVYFSLGISPPTIREFCFVNHLQVAFFFLVLYCLGCTKKRIEPVKSREQEETERRRRLKQA